jgi:hypothetical protein
MGRIYAVTFENVSVTAAQDFFELQPVANKPVSLIGLLLSQSSDLGDAQEEILRIQIIRGHATTGSGGTTPTAQPVNNSSDTAYGGVAEVNNTTIASAGTGVSLFSHCFNIRAGLEHYFPPECRPGASTANVTIVVRLMAAPADALSMNGTLYFEEL